MGSDSIDEPKRLIGINKFDYDYKYSQLFTSSDKITINSRTDNITLSSFNNTIIGAGNHIDIISNNYTTIEDTYQDPSHYGAPRSIKIGLEIRY